MAVSAAGGHGGGPHRAKPAHVQRQTGGKLVMKRYKMEEMEEHNFLEMVALTS